MATTTHAALLDEVVIFEFACVENVNAPPEMLVAPPAVQSHSLYRVFHVQ